jgi:hypothetical protein
MSTRITFAEWRDRIAWGSIVGLLVTSFSWAMWITDRTYRTPSAEDLRELNLLIDRNTTAIHNLDKTVARLTDRLPLLTANQPP